MTTAERQQVAGELREARRRLRACYVRLLADSEEERCLLFAETQIDNALPLLEHAAAAAAAGAQDPAARADPRRGDR